MSDVAINGSISTITRRFALSLENGENLFNNGHFGVIFLDNDIVTDQNQKATQLLKRDLKGYALPFFNEIIVAKNKIFDYDITLSREILSACCSITDLGDDKYLFIFIDITKRIELREELLFQRHLVEYNSSYDSLTQLSNRDQCLKLIQYKITTQAPFTLAFIDIDNFKYINDTYGHDIGDEVLKLFAKRLKTVFKHKEVYRLSGDEFALICDCGNISKNIVKLLEANEQSLDFDDGDYLNNIYVTCSIGMTEFPKDAPDLKSLLKCVDFAMYNCKKNGKNNFAFYDPQMKIDNLKELVLKNDILYSIDADLFELYYQPQIDSTTGELVGLEGLVRWNHPDRGLIFPGDFIGIAEKNGLIVKLDRYLMEKGIKQVLQLRDQYGYKYKISLNLSTKQLESNFTQFISDILEQYQTVNDCIKLEVTETEVMKNYKQSVKILKYIESLGVELVIDDFGTGYSSLQYLDELPITTLKIDKCFVDNIGKNETTIKAIISLAQNLKLNIIAEGVETQEQIDFLKDHDVTIIQGYFYDKPLPFDKLIEKYFKG